MDPRQLKQLAKQIKVNVRPYFIEQRQEGKDNLYVFGYQVNIHNQSNQPVQLLSRHWLITDANGNRSEVQGEGVIGQQPRLPPGDEYQYSSGTIFKTPVGAMEGQYTLVTDQGQEFQVAIQPFRLAVPHIIN